LELEELEVYRRRPAEVVALGLEHLGAFDAEDRHPAAVRAPHVDADEITAPYERKATQE